MCNLYLWMDWMWNKRYDAQVTQDGLSMNGLAYIVMFAASLTPISRIYVHSTAATAKKHCPVGFNCPTPWCRTFWFCLQSLWRRAQLSRSRRMILKLWNHAKISCGLVHCTTRYLIRYTSHQWRGCLIRVSEALALLLVFFLGVHSIGRPGMCKTNFQWGLGGEHSPTGCCVLYLSHQMELQSTAIIRHDYDFVHRLFSDE